MDNVDRGVEWLNENGPAEWWDLVDLDSLVMSDPTQCVAGQVFAAQAATSGGGYRNGYDEVWDMMGGADMVDGGARGIVDHGFSCENEQTFDQLRERWVEEIEKIRAEVNA